MNLVIRWLILQCLSFASNFPTQPSSLSRSKFVYVPFARVVGASQAAYRASRGRINHLVCPIGARSAVFSVTASLLRVNQSVFFRK